MPQSTMQAMVLEKTGQPLQLIDLPIPTPTTGQVLLRVKACAVCRTDLHVVDGELPDPALPLIPGHQIVGIVEALGEDVTRFRLGDRVGVPWLGKTCQHCRYCLRGQEKMKLSRLSVVAKSPELQSCKFTPINWSGFVF